MTCPCCRPMVEIWFKSLKGPRKARRCPKGHMVVDKTKERV